MQKSFLCTLLRHLPVEEHYQNEQINIGVNVNWTKTHTQFPRFFHAVTWVRIGLECSTQLSPVNDCTKPRLHSRHIPRRNYPFAFYFPRLPHLCPLTVLCFQLYMLSSRGCSVEESYGLEFGRGLTFFTQHSAPKIHSHCRGT